VGWGLSGRLFEDAGSLGGGSRFVSLYEFGVLLWGIYAVPGVVDRTDDDGVAVFYGTELFELFDLFEA